MNYSHPSLNFFFQTNNNINNSKKVPITIDVYIPSLQLGFEAQGEQHYNMQGLMGDPAPQQLKDKYKREKCQEIGITLIEIPYWWDCKLDSLIATIRAERPELLSDSLIHHQQSLGV